MGCTLNGGDNVTIEKKYYALGQCGFCCMHAQKSTIFQSKWFQKVSRI